MRCCRLIISLCIVLILTLPVSAEDLLQRQAELAGVDQLEDALGDDARKMMAEVDPLEQTNLFEGALSIFKNALKSNEGTLKTALRTLVHILLIVILCLIAEVFLSEKGAGVVTVAGTLAIMAFCASDFYAMVGLGKKTMEEVRGFSDVLLPVMVSAATMSGSLTGSGIVYTLSTVFSNLLVRFSNSILVPAVYAYLALAMTDTVLQQSGLKRLRELLGWVIENGLKAVVYVYTGFLSVTGLLTGAADEAALKATKAALSGTVPVVGGIISNAASSVLSGAVVLKNAVGVFGMLSVLAVFAAPFIKMGISYLMFKLSTALSGVFDSKHSAFLEAISSVMGYMLAMTASCALISLIACCFLIKVVHI